MTSYKRLSQEQQERIAELEKQVHEMTNLDGMCDALSNDEAKEVLTTFAERVQNRAELLMLMRAVSKL